ncbi:uncharacterized protein LOC135492377 isoform X2 [Lineus longissimus]|uniref:uncharacterized protein LOC135492377 isoform X2 n=1 Tax=Lineus longissimus TaxID=88925 RepID=UPI00315C6FAF
MVGESPFLKFRHSDTGLKPTPEKDKTETNGEGGVVVGGTTELESKSSTKNTNCIDQGSKVEDNEINKLMEERDTVMEQLKEFVGMTKNTGHAGDEWESVMDSYEKMITDTNIREGCLDEDGCAHHCVPCDKHLSGIEPLRAHLKSNNHHKKIGLKKSGDITNAQPFRSDGAFRDGRLRPCGEHACTHHCQVCNKCMTGATPATQHLDSDKHKKKERDMTNSYARNVERPPSASGQYRIATPGSSRASSTSDCLKPGCNSHCTPCEMCFATSDEFGNHGKTPEHQSKFMSGIVALGAMRTASECGNDINSMLNGSGSSRSLESFSSLGTSLAWDGYDPSFQPNFIQVDTCTAIGCSYHCTCCDTHLSGEEPMKQHISSIKHLNMEQVYTKGMAGQNGPTLAESSRSLSNGDSLYSLGSMLDNLSLTSIAGNDPEEVIGSCGKTGCAFHCNLCSTCLSGCVPRDQHVASKNHRQVRERLERASQSLAKPECAVRELSMAPSLSPDTGVELATCSQPGCAFHCHVCDAHLTGREPMQQHMASKNHEKRKKATANLRMQPASSASRPVDDEPEVSEATCTHIGCRFHCNICDMHLSGLDPMKQHMDSGKHHKKKQAFLKLGGQSQPFLAASNQLLNPSTSSTQEISEPNPFALMQPQQRPLPKPIGYERSIQSLSPPLFPSSSDIRQQLTTPRQQLATAPQAFLHSGVFRTLSPRAPGYANNVNNLVEPVSNASQQDLSKSVFGICPDSSRICMYHCFACEKHFNEKLPKQQHETSAKHKKAAQRYLAGLKTRVVQKEDSFIVPSAGSTDLPLKTQLKTSKSSSSLTGLPKWLGEDRQFPPVVKTPQAKYSPQTKTVPRDYQMELYHKAMKDDTVCFLPTGTGKTLVSALVIDHMLQLNPTRPILFLVEKILLVLQQTKYLRTELGQRRYQRFNPRTNTMEMHALNVAGLCSGHTDACGKSSLQELDVIVTTAGFFLNILSKKWLKWQDFSLVVIDEVHHCTKKHAYNTLMQENHLQLLREIRPKLFGMTASPAGEANVPLTQEMLQRLLDNIGMAKLCVVEDHDKQLGEFQSRTVLEIDLAKMSEEETQLEDDIQMYLRHIFNFLVKTTNLGNLCKELGLNIQEGQRAILNATELTGEGLEAFRSSLGMIDVKDRCAKMGRFIKKIIAHADAVCGALLGLRLCGEEAVYHSLKPLAEDVNYYGFEEMAKVGFNCKGLQSRADSYESNIDERRKKMTAFWRLVHRIVTSVEWNAFGPMEKRPIVMVIVRERKVAKLLATLLQSNSDVQARGLNVEYIVGHGDGNVGMSVSRQRRMLEETWQHKYQVLVATSVAEEGLDLPECKLVIEMDPPGNVTSLVQIRGRARKQCSKLVALCRSEDQVDKIKELEDREQCMMIAARAVVGLQNTAAKRLLLSGSM